jgi:hypothetical protein
MSHMSKQNATAPRKQAQAQEPLNDLSRLHTALTDPNALPPEEKLDPSEWLWTPRVEYFLEMWPGKTEHPQQHVDMSAAEYHELKRRLAELRGYELSQDPEEKDDGNVASEQPLPDEDVDPPKELVEKALDLIIQRERVDFANDLEQAITFFRKYPDLVKRGKIPEEFRAAYVREYDTEPLHMSLNDDYMRKGFKSRAKKEAEKIARGWMKRDREKHAAHPPSSDATVKGTVA